MDWLDDEVCKQLRKERDALRAKIAAMERVVQAAGELVEQDPLSHAFAGGLQIEMDKYSALVEAYRAYQQERTP